MKDLNMGELSNFETGCCPKFNPENWQEKEIQFANKLFVKDHLLSIFHIPINFGAVMKKNIQRIEDAGVKANNQLVLTDEKSPWGSDVYIAIEKEVPGLETVKISGTYLTKVFEGSYRNMGTYIQQMQSFVKSKGKASKKNYFYYPYCPNCAKADGHNYIVILAQL